MIGIVIPACNEEAHLKACLNAIQKAIDFVKNQNIHIQTLVVLDSCQDQSKQITQQMNIPFIECQVQNVGIARDLGVRALIEQGAQWIACTDADSCVYENWLLEQIKLQPIDAICGVVQISDWGRLSPETQMHYLEHYQDRMGHHHIHGANLSFSAEAYLKVGGFEAIQCHEDIRLVQRLKAFDLKIIWSNQVRVNTSSRLNARAPEGFSQFLIDLENKNIMTSKQES
ncbi:glycosyltransferase [Acinetobacter shaoyimingii]|uniref:Glycosyltransferase n=1 Tax=Acinetobacter shaoyimingii TaxID=2715164 RepID=A0A6G8RVB5_9GAMM|nr:glycosyltransferase [Acinetobacter shaoyimingii]NHB58986.1 glycosyltransferase [Acinetobacter shaoyimingii]QIO05835.1 glycosyltransferase [Acinetobacter shaoyimingii]